MESGVFCVGHHHHIVSLQCRIKFKASSLLSNRSISVQCGPSGHSRRRCSIVCLGFPQGQSAWLLSSRKYWVTLYRARAKVGKTASSMHTWNLAPTSECPCGEPNQTMQHIITDCPLGPVCTDRDLVRCNRNAKNWISHWRDKT